MFLQMYKKLAAGVTAGCTAAMIANPLDILKVRLQAQASGANASVGHQHGYTGIAHGVSKILEKEGIVGLYNGIFPSMLRLALGSASQLTAYTTLKEHAMESGWKDGPPTHIACSMLSVVFGVTSMQPGNLPGFLHT
jgi:solute carrier family 25 protein 34/35